MHTQLHRLLLGILGFAFVIASSPVMGLASVDQIAFKGKPVAANPDWPAGVLELVNDPLRTDGWHPWFSECSNDVSEYAMQAATVEAMNHLMAKLAAIQHPDCQVRLTPEKELTHLGFGFPAKKGVGNTATFSIGDQKQMNRWFENLEKAKGSDLVEGTRAFGVHRYREAPKALPPTLTLYLGDPKFDLEKLKFPPTVKVLSDTPEYVRDKGENKELLRKLDALAAKHTKARQESKASTEK